MVCEKMKNKSKSNNEESVISVAKNNFVYTFIAVLLFVLISFCKPLFLLDQNQILYLFSASAQVLAAVYGLVLTAFSFIQNSIEKKGAKDPDLEGIWDRMTQQCFNMLIYISIMTFLSIVLCMTTMSSCDEKIICKFLINVSIVFVVNDLYLIIKFVIKFANPKWEDSIRGEVIKKFGGDVKGNGSGNDNSVQLFLAYFQKIERVLAKASAPFINYKGYNRSRFISKKEMVLILSKNGFFKENDDVVAKILDLIPFRNSLVHSSVEQGVPDYIMNLTKDVFESLKKSLKDTEQLKNFDWNVKISP